MDRLRDLTALASLDWTLPEAHRTAARKRFECADGWWILGHDRDAGDYYEAYKRSMTPVQIVRYCRRRGVVSLLTPCAQTEGRFELYAQGKVQRYCCYRCAYRCVWDSLDVLLPQAEQWMIYMLLDTIGFIENPNAPVERAKSSKGGGRA